MKVRICSLSKNEDFKSILNGKKISNNYSTIFFKKLNHLNSKQLNISFIAKKRLGNAVIRNKIKRRLKNIMRDLIKNVKINYEYSYLIIAKKIVFNHKFVDIKRELFGTKRKLNDLENWELGKLINVLRIEYAKRKKLHKRNDHKRKNL